MSLTPPPLPNENIERKKWRGLRSILALVAGGFLVLVILGSSSPPKLELTRITPSPARDGMAVEVVNVGSGPITITKITINERADCSVITRAQEIEQVVSRQKPTPEDNQFKVATLAVGDKIIYVSSCQIIRAAVETDQGSNTYSFNR